MVKMVVVQVEMVVAGAGVGVLAETGVYLVEVMMVVATVEDMVAVTRDIMYQYLQLM